MQESSLSAKMVETVMRSQESAEASQWASLLGEHEASHQRARDLAQALTREQLNWRSRGAWSIAECLAHCATTNKLVGESINSSVMAGPPGDRGARGIRLPSWMEHPLIRFLEPPVHMKFKAPRILQPVPSEYDEEIVDIFIRSHDSFIETIKAGGEGKLENIYFPHPVVSLRLPVSSGLRFMAVHDRRHLWQAEQIQGLPSFPR
jgi:hypothetical protein